MVIVWLPTAIDVDAIITVAEKRTNLESFIVDTS